MTLPQNTTVVAAGDTILVDVQSPWFSRINWTQVVGMGATILMIASGNKLSISPEMQGAFIVAIQGIQTVVTMVLRTWFSKSVTPGSMNATAKIGS